jgi:hypothetical protein
VPTAAEAIADDFHGPFPTAAELARVTERPLPADALSTDVVEVETWELAGPLADHLSPGGTVPASIWHDQLQARIAGKAGVAIATPELGCVARELGRFYLEMAAQPGDELRRFIVGRCGAASVATTASFLSGEVADDVGEPAIQEKWRTQIDQMITNQADAGNRALGIWFGRGKGRVVVAVAAAARSVHAETAPLRPGPDGMVTFRGELLVPADRVRALINRGAYGVGECELEPGVALPRFGFRCKTEPTDPIAVIELAAFPAGRGLRAGWDVGGKVRHGQLPPRSPPTPTISPT